MHKSCILPCYLLWEIHNLMQQSKGKFVYISERVYCAGYVVRWPSISPMSALSIGLYPPTTCTSPLSVLCNTVSCYIVMGIGYPILEWTPYVIEWVR